MFDILIIILFESLILYVIFTNKFVIETVEKLEKKITIKEEKKDDLRSKKKKINQKEESNTNIKKEEEEKLGVLKTEKHYQFIKEAFKVDLTKEDKGLDSDRIVLEMTPEDQKEVLKKQFSPKQGIIKNKKYSDFLKEGFKKDVNNIQKENKNINKMTPEDEKKHLKHQYGPKQGVLSQSMHDHFLENYFVAAKNQKKQKEKEEKQKEKITQKKPGGGGSGVNSFKNRMKNKYRRKKKYV